MIISLRFVTIGLTAAMLCISEVSAAEVQALFDLSGTATSPFPSDRFTVADENQITGLRVDLPKPDCSQFPSDCVDIDLLNELDGFNVQPRVSIPFSGSIDPNTVSGETVFLFALGDETRVSLNQLVWDVETKSLHGIADQMLKQHASYLIIVTRDVLDSVGDPIEPSMDFRHFDQAHDPATQEYRVALLRALGRAAAAGIKRSDVVAASLFTTQSVTASLEKIRDQIKAATPDPADFLLGPGGTRTVFRLAEVGKIEIRNQVSTAPTFANPVNARLDLLKIFTDAPDAVATVASGKFKSPIYVRSPESVMPPFATRTGTPEVLRTADVHFSLFLPSGVAPAGGWPVVIYGDGQSGGNPWGNSFNVAASLAKQGLAMLTPQPPYQGLGALSTATVTFNTGAPSVTFPTGGRSIDQNGDGIISTGEGFLAAPPRQILNHRDVWRQGSADLMQLVRVLEVGMDVDGDGTRDVDPSRIYYLGYSGGAWRGTAFAALDPAVRASVFQAIGFGGHRHSPGNRAFFGSLLERRTPSLINPAGTPVVTMLDGVPVNRPWFNENLPFRDQPPVINTVAGAMNIQQWLDRNLWLNHSVDPVAFAPFFRKDPLPGVPVRPVIAQFARGDQTIPNPSASHFLRAGNLADRALLYRHDLAWARPENQGKLVKNPHPFWLMIEPEFPQRAVFARAAQTMIATFLASDGQTVIDPDGPDDPFFEMPIIPPLPEDLGFIP